MKRGNRVKNKKQTKLLSKMYLIEQYTLLSFVPRTIYIDIWKCEKNVLLVSSFYFPKESKGGFDNKTERFCHRTQDQQKTFKGFRFYHKPTFESLRFGPVARTKDYIRASFL